MGETPVSLTKGSAVIDYKKKRPKIDYTHPARREYVRIQRLIRPGDSLLPGESLILGSNVAERSVVR